MHRIIRARVVRRAARSVMLESEGGDVTAWVPLGAMSADSAEAAAEEEGTGAVVPLAVEESALKDGGWR